jgi:hypothetical protein
LIVGPIVGGRWKSGGWGKGGEAKGGSRIVSMVDSCSILVQQCS